jgi:hypothetical protein
MIPTSEITLTLRANAMYRTTKNARAATNPNLVLRALMITPKAMERRTNDELHEPDALPEKTAREDEKCEGGDRHDSEDSPDDDGPEGTGDVGTECSDNSTDE